ncbi:MAG: SPW repeat domain-containing protein [Aureispira sp.]
MKFVTKRIHAYLDYPVALALIGMPFLLGLGTSNSFAFTLSLVTGIAALLLTVLTDHHLGLIKIVSYKMHLFVDLLVGIVFIAAPFILGFKGMDMIYYLINGGAVLFVVSMHKEQEGV